MIYVGTQYYRRPRRRPTAGSAISGRPRSTASTTSVSGSCDWYCQREGVYNFDSLKRLLDLCQKHGMKAILLTNLDRSRVAGQEASRGGLPRRQGGSTCPSRWATRPPAASRPLFPSRSGRPAWARLHRGAGAHLQGSSGRRMLGAAQRADVRAGALQRPFLLLLRAVGGAVPGVPRGEVQEDRALNRLAAQLRAFDEVQPPRRGHVHDWLDWRLFWLETLVGTLEWRIAPSAGTTDHYVMLHTRAAAA